MKSIRQAFRRLGTRFPPAAKRCLVVLTGLRQIDESFGRALRWRFLPFVPIWFVLAAERSAWFLAPLPIVVGLMWFQTRNHRNGM